MILGIETSCDETAAAVVSDEGERILSNVVLSQIEDHKPYGGIVPEVAARAHMEHVDAIVDAAMKEAGVTFDDIDAVAATGGPGLIGGVIVGVMTEPLANAEHVAARAVTPGDTVFVIGSGPIGALMVRAAAIHGASRILATDTNEVTIISPDGSTDSWPILEKTEVASRLWDLIEARLPAGDQRS